MNWSSTIDAEFMCATISCFTADEVFMQLKASNTIGDDLIKPFDTDSVSLDSVQAIEDFKWTIVLRKWHDGHNKGMEFRCYVRDGILLGVVQKDDTAGYAFLANKDLLGVVYERITELIKSKVIGALKPLQSFILDVYIDIAPRHKAWVQDVSPYIPGT